MHAHTKRSKINSVIRISGVIITVVLPDEKNTKVHRIRHKSIPYICHQSFGVQSSGCVAVDCVCLLFFGISYHLGYVSSIFDDAVLVSIIIVPTWIIRWVAFGARSLLKISQSEIATNEGNSTDLSFKMNNPSAAYRRYIVWRSESMWQRVAGPHYTANTGITMRFLSLFITFKLKCLPHLSIDLHRPRFYLDCLS